MEMTMNLPGNYGGIEEEEMMYLEGGFSISRGVFVTACNIGAMAAFTCLSGGIAVRGLRTVLASYTLRRNMVRTMVRAVGVLGIKIGNSLQSRLISGIASASLTDFFGSIFDRYIDGLDGRKNKAIKIW